MISAQEVAELAGSLGTAQGLARVEATIASLREALADSRQAISRVELARMIGALDSLSAAILALSEATRAMLGQHRGAVDCVG